MSRSSLVVARALSGVAIAALTVGIPGRASAQSPTPSPTGERAVAPQPVLDAAPRAVRYRGTAVIEGHLERGRQHDHLWLQRRARSRAWRTVSRLEVEGDSRVRFQLNDRRATSEYRLMWTDGTERTYSEVARVSVRPRLTLRARPRHALLGTTVRLEGRLYPDVTGREVKLQHKIDGSWRTIARARVRDGHFRASFQPHAMGRRGLRAVFAGDSRNLSARRRTVVGVYDPDYATWYGPGFYGRRTACGRVLRYDTLGVAHRHLPCGTKVRVLYRGRTVTLPVIDRGPYSAAEWDLTGAAARRLGFSGTGWIGTLH